MGPQVSEVDFARAVSELTAEYRAAEAVRWAKRKLSKKRYEAPREPTEDEIVEASAGVPDYPILTVSKKQFYARMCKCTRYLIASKCDCQICSYISVNMRAFHMARGKWDPNGRCERGTCDACTSDSPYRQASRSPQDMMAFLLCSKCRPFDIQPPGSPPTTPHSDLLQYWGLAIAALHLNPIAAAAAVALGLAPAPHQPFPDSRTSAHKIASSVTDAATLTFARLPAATNAGAPTQAHPCANPFPLFHQRQVHVALQSPTEATADAGAVPEVRAPATAPSAAVSQSNITASVASIARTLINSPLFGAAVAALVPTTPPIENVENRDGDSLSSSPEEALFKDGEKLLLSIRQQELRLNGAAKQFMSFCPLCVKGRHERLVFGRFVSLVSLPCPHPPHILQIAQQLICPFLILFANIFIFKK